MSGVPYIFGTATTSIPLSQLDTDFATPVTIGSTTVALGNTTTTLAGLTGVTSSAITDSGLTSGRVTYAGTGGLLQDSANLTFNGTTLTANTLNLTNALGTSYGGTGLTSFTANGVVYASSTSALATGSALTFDGTSLGLGTASPGVKFDIVSGNNTSLSAVLRVNSNNVAVNTSLAYDGLVGSGQLTVQAGTSGALIFGANAAEQMRLTSTGLGIGTSSPTYPLTVQANSSTQGIRIIGRATGNLSNMSFVANNGSTEYAYISSGPTYLTFGVNSSDRATIDSSGNLGLGVTPSAWNSSWKVVQVKNASFWSTGNDASITANAYYDGTDYRYIASVNATRVYHNTNGVISWFQAPSGTAGAVATFTQAMTLDASGNLMVGTTSPAGGASKFNVYGTQTYDSAGSTIANWYNAGTLIGYIGQGNYAVSGASASGISFASQSSMSFATGGQTERARIDSSGNLLVGTTTAGYANSNSIALLASSGYGIVNHPSGSASGSSYLSFGYNLSQIGSISQSGTTAVLYNLTSDQRLKENIQDAESSSNLIDSIQVRQFNWKSDNSHQRYGFIAQELVTVAPEAVHQPIDSEEMMGVDYSKLVPMLVKEIQSLRARVAQLETKGV